MANHAIEVVVWTPCERNTLRGLADIRGVRGLHLIISGVAMHERDGRRWAQLPAKPLVINGELVRGDERRPRYMPCLEFEDRETANAFSQACWSALEVYQQS